MTDYLLIPRHYAANPKPIATLLFGDNSAYGPVRVGIFSDSTHKLFDSHGDKLMGWRKKLWHDHHGHSPCSDIQYCVGNFGNSNPYAGWMAQAVMYDYLTRDIANSYVPPSACDQFSGASAFGDIGTGRSGSALWLNQANTNSQTQGCGAVRGYQAVLDFANGGAADLADPRALGGTSYIDMNAGLRLKIVALTSPNAHASVKFREFDNTAAEFCAPTEIATNVSTGTLGSGLDAAVGSSFLLQTPVLSPLASGKAIKAVQVCGNGNQTKKNTVFTWFESENKRGVHLVDCSYPGYHSGSLLDLHADSMHVYETMGMQIAHLIYGINDNAYPNNPTEYDANIEANLDALFDAGVQYAILETATAATDDVVGYGDEYPDKLYQRAQADSRIVFLNTRRVLAERYGWTSATALSGGFTTDGKHHSAYGAELVARTSWELLGRIMSLTTTNPACTKSIMMLLLQASNNFPDRLDVAGVSGDKRRSAIGFDSIAGIAAGSKIKSDILTLTVSAGDSSLSGANEFRCHPMTTFDWTEAGTWQTKNGVDSWDATGGADLGGGDFEPTNGRTDGLLQPTTTGVKTYDIYPTGQWCLDHNPTTPHIELKCANEALADPAYPVFDSRSDGATGPSRQIISRQPAATLTSSVINADGQLVLVFDLISESWNNAVSAAASNYTVSLTRAGSPVTLTGSSRSLSASTKTLTITVTLDGPIYSTDTSVTASLAADKITDDDVIRGDNGHTNAAVSSAATTNNSTASSASTPRYLDLLESPDREDASEMP